MVFGVENLLSGKSVLGELKVALEEFTLAGTLSIHRFERTTLSRILPGVLFELSDACIAVFFSHTFLAVFEGLALVVKSILKR